LNSDSLFKLELVHSCKILSPEKESPWQS
jgi:hypothetical protein